MSAHKSSKQLRIPLFSECRDLMHAWVPLGAHREGKLWVRTLRCNRCDTRRKDWLNLDGSKAVHHSNSYTYPKGYKVEGGPLTVDERAALRLHNILEGSNAEA